MAEIYSINGSVISVLETHSFSMKEVVRVGKEGLLGEVIRIDVTKTMIQVYESTVGLHKGDPVVGMGSLLNVTL